MKEIMPKQTKQARKEVQASTKEGAAGRRHQVLTPGSCTACRLTKGLTGTWGANEGSGDEGGGRRGAWTESEPGEGGRKDFSLSGHLIYSLLCFSVPK